MSSKVFDLSCIHSVLQLSCSRVLYGMSPVFHLYCTASSVLPWIRPVLHPSCHDSVRIALIMSCTVLYCICSVLHLTFPAPVLSTIRPALNLSCTASDLFCSCPVLHPSCTASNLSYIHLGLHQSCPATVLYCIWHVFVLYCICPVLHLTCPASDLVWSICREKKLWRNVTVAKCNCGEM